MPTLYQQTNFPFSLVRFACYFLREPSHLFNLFATQPSIRSLTIYEPDYPSYTRRYIRANPPLSILPNLTSIRANPLTIHSLVPGRPVSHADSGSAILFNTTAYLFCESLKESTAPSGIQSVAVCILETKFWTGASDFITRLAGVCGPCLKELKLTTPDLSVGMARLGDYVALVEVLVASLEGFTRLERFEFSDMQIEIMTPEILAEGLGSVGTLAFWQTRVPTLRNVTLFGVNLA
ncbi:hypothetical protein CTheo_1134 [Ceratobasidium theobromae]|uniref:Uncharacterized protein n=1 Tax=Ceratobasidium theobromae TaxID=1582974 RepID=A0A5N5QWB5_9AGAM|nr:hypothetical protein CTheo_1134 [Ceratobasidium theobromae]